MTSFECFWQSLEKMKSIIRENEFHSHFNCKKRFTQRPNAKVTLHSGFILIENIDQDYLGYWKNCIQFECHIIWCCTNCNACQAVIKPSNSTLAVDMLFHRLYHIFDEQPENCINTISEETIPPEFDCVFPTQATTIYHITNTCIIIQNAPKEHIHNVTASPSYCTMSFVYKDKICKDNIHVLHKIKSTCEKYVNDADCVLAETAESCKWLLHITAGIKHIPIHKRSQRLLTSSKMK